VRPPAPPTTPLELTLSPWNPGPRALPPNHPAGPEIALNVFHLTVCVACLTTILFLALFIATVGQQL
jgi:hypothetical protein